MDTKSEADQDKERIAFHPFYNIARRILLAGIGAVALSHDEVEEFVDKLVERGEIARIDGDSLLKEVKDRRKKFLHGEETVFHKHMEEFFENFHVPAKKDLDDLAEKIASLEKKIDELTNIKK